jgi:Skp family chaperone for outer membrane proteins
MIRWTALAAFAVALTGAALVAGSNREDAPKPEKAAKPASTTGFFNMAKVMRENKRAKNEIEKMNAKRARATINLQVMRASYTDMQGKVVNAVGKEKEELSGEMLKLARKIEDADREIQKSLNDRATAILTKIYDELHATVAGIAKENGLLAVLAYPDATTPEEQNSPMIKELKLKPPAAQPFYLDPSVDFSDEIVKRLNAKYVAEEDEK